MRDVMAGTRVLEVATWTFVPAAGAVLADWGADVIKIEHPVTGDPQRGLITSGLVPAGTGGVNYMIEFPNRGKRSVALDISTDEGREILYDVARRSDVFLTSFLPRVRRKLKIDVDDIRAVNPDIVYVRGSGQGVRGPDAERGGYDGASYWARGGLAMALTPPDYDWPIGPRPAFGDVMGGMTIAGGIAAALYRREKTGVASVVDVSLLGTAMWNLQPDIVASGLYDRSPIPAFRADDSPNPVVGYYKTKDERFLALMMLESDRYWPDLCEHLDHPELATDPRFSDAAKRFENRRACIATLRSIFESRTLGEWAERFRTLAGVWAPMLRSDELLDDEQAIANGYLPELPAPDGTSTFRLVANPVQFDETPPTPDPAPEHGQHTEEVLLELGRSWEDIAAHKDAGVIL